MKRNVLVALPLLALALASGACSTSAGGGSATGARTGTGVQVSARQVSGVGTVLVDASGRTLYFADQEKDGTIRCTGACTQIWRPLGVSGGAPTAGAGVTGTLATVHRSDGVTQVTLDGRPLYTFSYDGGPGKVEGDNVTDSFGGTQFRWHAMTAGGTPAPASPSGGSGYGNGY
jgi:predicted lipoprotein with Yx(FWY)xxD motif